MPALSCSTMQRREQLTTWSCRWHVQFKRKSGRRRRGCRLCRLHRQSEHAFVQICDAEEREDDISLDDARMLWPLTRSICKLIADVPYLYIYLCRMRACVRLRLSLCFREMKSALPPRVCLMRLMRSCFVRRKIKSFGQPQYYSNVQSFCQPQYFSNVRYASVSTICFCFVFCQLSVCSCSSDCIDWVWLAASQVRIQVHKYGDKQGLRTLRGGWKGAPGWGT